MKLIFCLGGRGKKLHVAENYTLRAARMNANSKSYSVENQNNELKDNDRHAESRRTVESGSNSLCVPSDLFKLSCAPLLI